MSNINAFDMIILILEVFNYYIAAPYTVEHDFKNYPNFFHISKVERTIARAIKMHNRFSSEHILFCGLQSSFFSRFKS